MKCNKCETNNYLSSLAYHEHRNCNDTLISDASDRLEFENEQE